MSDAWQLKRHTHHAALTLWQLTLRQYRCHELYTHQQHTLAAQCIAICSPCTGTGTVARKSSSQSPCSHPCKVPRTHPAHPCTQAPCSHTCTICRTLTHPSHAGSATWSPGTTGPQHASSRSRWAFATSWPRCCQLARRIRYASCNGTSRARWPWSGMALMTLPRWHRRMWGLPSALGQKLQVCSAVHVVVCALHGTTVHVFMQSPTV